MSEHICPECGIDRTAIISRNCDTCHGWVEDLDMEYAEFQAMHEEDYESEKSSEDVAAIMGEANEKARNGEDGYTTH